MSSNGDNQANPQLYNFSAGTESPTKTFTPGERATAQSYAKEIDDNAHQIAANLPLTLRSRFLGYLKQPTFGTRATLSDELTNFIMDSARASYGNKSAESASDFHERAAFFYLVANGALTQIRDAVMPAGGDKSSMLGSLLTETVGRVSWSLPPIDEESLRRLIFNAGAMQAANRTEANYFSTRLIQMNEGLIQKKQVVDFLSKREEPTEPSEQKKANDELTESIKFLQKYLPKQCVAPAFRPGEVKEWLLTGALDSWDTIKLHPSHGLVLGLFGSNQTVETSYIGSRSEVLRGVRVSVIEGINAEDLVLEAGLGKDGQLYSLTGQRMIDFLPDNLRNQYEELRSEVLCLYHDCVVPVYVTELADQEVDMQESGRNIVGHQTKNSSEKLRRLVLARKLVDDTLRTEIIHEIENPDRDVIKRNLVKHEVIGHIRRLPRGFRASQYSREICMKDMGVVLAEYGETYVRTHNRGKLEGLPRGHRAAFTAGRVAMQRDNYLSGQ